MYLKHGHTWKGGCSRTYQIWVGMVRRCCAKKDAHYPGYGGRGIRVCPRWKQFADFFTDMGEAPAGLTLERKDNDKGYSKGNCVWATRLEQANNRRGNKNLTFRGETHAVREWSRRIGITHHALYSRLRRDWPLSRALIGAVTLQP